MSFAFPGAKGMTAWIVLLGQPCARARSGAANASAKQAKAPNAPRCLLVKEIVIGSSSRCASLATVTGGGLALL
jgi:hypothetical protein